MNPLYEGKAKRLFETDQPGFLRMVFKDDATAFDGRKKEQFSGKGSLNKAITLLLYEILEREGVPTHFAKDLGETEMTVRAVDIFPLEVVVRAVAAGSLSRRTGMAEGTPLPQPIVEFYYKNDDLGDPILTADHIALLSLATPEELDVFRSQGLRIYEILAPLFRSAGITLIDFKVEFGKDEHGQILLADEISPDTCRLWDTASGRKLDKDIFRRDLGSLLDGYQEFYDRLRHAIQD